MKHSREANRQFILGKTPERVDRIEVLEGWVSVEPKPTLVLAEGWEDASLVLGVQPCDVLACCKREGIAVFHIPSNPSVPSNPFFGVWIDVRSEQPKAEGSYLVYAPSADIDKPLVAIAWFTPGEGWSLLPQCWCNAITHWMPKPPPPNPSHHDDEAPAPSVDGVVQCQNEKGE